MHIINDHDDQELMLFVLANQMKKYANNLVEKCGKESRYREAVQGFVVLADEIISDIKSGRFAGLNSTDLRLSIMPAIYYLQEKNMLLTPEETE